MWWLTNTSLGASGSAPGSYFWQLLCSRKEKVARRVGIARCLRQIRLRQLGLLHCRSDRLGLLLILSGDGRQLRDDSVHVRARIWIRSLHHKIKINASGDTWQSAFDDLLDNMPRVTLSQGWNIDVHS